MQERRLCVRVTPTLAVGVVVVDMEQRVVIEWDFSSANIAQRRSNIPAKKCIIFISVRQDRYYYLSQGDKKQRRNVLDCDPQLISFFQSCVPNVLFLGCQGETLEVLPSPQGGLRQEETQENEGSATNSTNDEWPLGDV